MNARTLAIARKEWRAAFLSPVALIFLGIFLLASLFVLFYVKGFFARGIADARPFFEGMPVLLALLCSAFTMKLWSEETRSGTLEVLLTLPLKVREVVLGKFLAGLGLVAVALALTLAVPVTVEVLGDLDWGPVLGGYLGLLLLSSAYLALGLFVSSLTSNQLVSLLVSLVLCGVLILVGYFPSLITLGVTADEILRNLGTQSRFESMLRGVLDLRDLVYYASLALLFLLLNLMVLEFRRFGQSPRARPKRRSLGLAVGLVALNLLVFNIGLAPAASLRLDLTEWGEYSISPVTRRLLQGAQQPLLVRGYFSEKTHPLLNPLVPRIKDFLRELEAVGGANLTVEFVDPTDNEQAEKEAQSKYDIRSVPFRFSNRFEDSVVNAYFHVLVRYGDRHQVLGFGDIIDVEVQGTDVKVRLRNVEYDVARAMQKVIFGFKSLEAVCNQLPEKAELKVFASSAGLPDELQSVPETIKKVAGEVAGRCPGRFEFQVIDPDSPQSPMNREQIYKAYGIKPMLLSLFEQQTFYLALVLQVGQRAEVLSIPRKLTEFEIRREIEGALQRHSPGFLKTIGFFASETPRQAQMPGMPPPQGPTFRLLKRQLEGTYEVTDVDLSSGRVPGYVDVLLVVAPRSLGELERYAIDQFLMRGGSVIVAAGSYAFEPGMAGELNVNLQPTGLEDLLKHYGVELRQAVALDEQNASFPIPVTRQLGGFTVREIRLVRYPPFVLVQGEGLSRENPATAAIPSVVLNWPSPVACLEGEAKPGGNGAEKPVCSVLLRASGRAWAMPYFNAQPDYQRFPEFGFATPDKFEELPLAVSVAGRLTSYFKDKKPPVLGEKEPPGAKKEQEKGGTRGSVIERSEQDARLVVVGSSSFLQDLILSVSSQVSDAHLSNLQFANNLVDWSVEDVGLLQIRAKEQYARTLSPLSGGAMIAWQVGNFALVVLAVIIIGLVTLGRRATAASILAEADKKGRQP